MPTNVADLHVDRPDAMDQTIVAFYGRRPPEYAVYRTDQRVMIHFADSEIRAAQQREAMAKLNPLRGEITGLIDGWRGSDRYGAQKRADRYDRRVGDALVVAFEGDIAGAERLLQIVKQDVLSERVARGRLEYLVAAFVTACLGLVVVAAVTLLKSYEADGLDLWRAAAAGAAGAFFSISLGIRGRTVLPDLERVSNILDAVLRVVVGLIGAAVVVGLIRLGAVDLQISGHKISEQDPLRWLLVLIIGFVAGFSERFVPDLLGQTLISVVGPQAPGANHAEGVLGSAASGAASGSLQSATPTPEAVATDDQPADELAEETALDCCVENLDLPEDLVTQDADLPAAAGGVEKSSINGGS